MAGGGPGPGNPTALFEVLIDSTAAYDAGEKFAHYRQIRQLQEYVLGSQRERRIELRRRGPDGDWATVVAGRGGVVHLASLGVDLVVDGLYDRSPLTRLV